MKMKKILSMAAIFLVLLSITSCGEKDEGKLPNISFKTGVDYASTDVTVPAGAEVLIGIQASKAEGNDVLKTFNISKSVNGGPNTTVYSATLTGDQGDAYTYDYTATAAATTGENDLYTFTVTNRDGLINQVLLTVSTE